MNFHQLPHYRFYETIPGITIWTIFLTSIFLSFFKPIWVIYFIILYDLYWFFRVIIYLIYTSVSWRRYRETIKIDWLSRVKKIPNWQKIYHLIFFATYKEGIDVVKPSFEALVNSDYPKKKMIVVLAGEERDKENFLKIAEEIKKNFSDKFFKLLITVHPKNLPDEIPGKGSNIHYAGKQAKKLIDDLKIPYENIIVSSFDIDTCVHPKYFSYLTYRYLTIKDPTHTSFQPIALFNNNIWDSPAFTRVVSRGTTFWLLNELSKPNLYFTFSSHSMSFKALVDVGFWQKDIVTEDSRIFLQCYNHYNGNYKTVPLYISVLMDTVYCGSIWRTIVNQYKQMLRWGYGVENVPWMIWHFSRNKKMSFFKKIPPFWVQFEGSCSWATAPILILLLGNLPIWIARHRQITDALIQNAPFVLERLMTVATIGLFFSGILSTILLPPRPPHRKIYNYLFMVFQWFLFPITMIVFGAIPAAEAITRLMLGKYLGFRVTEKKRIK